MELRVIDFDILTRSFQPYIDGYKAIESEKRAMLDSIQPVRKEMELIISRSSSEDEATQKVSIEKFRELQEGLVKSDSEFKMKLKKMQEDLNTSTYDHLAEIISEWATQNSINLVRGKMEVIFNTNDIDVTEQILELLKEKEMFYTETVSGEVVQPTV